MASDRVFGPQVDLEATITRHVFLISPNQSGSTFLIRALGLCDQAWRLPRESQHAFGYVGPDTLARGTALTWASSAENIDFIRNADAYDWCLNRKAWYFQASAARPDAQVFVTKSPPFLLITDQLVHHFKQTSLIHMVRNPYAVVEGILRRGLAHETSRENTLKTAANHVLNCFLHQKRNLETPRGSATFFTYEDMCANPAKVTEKIIKIIPEFGDLDLDRKIEVKGMYDERLRDMNADHIARLTPSDLRVVNAVFEPKAELFNYFGYGMISK